MSFLTDTIRKKSNCWHVFETKNKQATNERYQVCTKCGYTRKAQPKNSSLIPFLLPVFQQSNFLAKLPLGKVRDFVNEHQFMTNWLTVLHDGWRLPAVEDPYDWCGLWQTKACRNVKLHAILGHENKIFLKQYQRSCYRPVCKKCFTKWIAREADKATRRIEKGSKALRMKPIHLVLSVNPKQHSFSFKALKKMAIKIVKDLDIVGAAIIFHSYRYNKGTREFYYSPQFHVVGFGYIKGRCTIPYQRYGWYTAYLGVRKSVFQTFVYILSHAGIKQGIHTVTWLGKLSYSKLHVEKGPDPTLCPYCYSKLEQVYYEYEFHPDVPPGEYFEGLVDAEGWYPVTTFSQLPTDYEYAPTRDLNETLKGLMLAN